MDCSNEAFFESIRSVVSTLKFRYSDGKIGSDAGIASGCMWIVGLSVHTLLQQEHLQAELINTFGVSVPL